MCQQTRTRTKAVPNTLHPERRGRARAGAKRQEEACREHAPIATYLEGDEEDCDLGVGHEGLDDGIAL